MVAGVSNHKIAFRVERNTAASHSAAPGRAFAANAADVGAITQPKYLNAAVAVPIMHDDVAVKVDGNAGRDKRTVPARYLGCRWCGRENRPRNSALARDDYHFQPQPNDRRHQALNQRTVKLAIACALLADGPQVLPIAVP
jgi:hypothetical protein